MKISREAALVLRDLRPGSPAARMAEQRKILARRHADDVIDHGQLAELDEMIAAAARTELAPRAILQARGHRRHGPVAIHHFMLARRSKRGADAKTRFALERARQSRLAVGQHR